MTLLQNKIWKNYFLYKLTQSSQTITAQKLTNCDNNGKTDNKEIHNICHIWVFF